MLLLGTRTPGGEHGNVARTRCTYMKSEFMRNPGSPDCVHELQIVHTICRLAPNIDILRLRGTYIYMYIYVYSIQRTTIVRTEVLLTACTVQVDPHLAGTVVADTRVLLIVQPI